MSVVSGTVGAVMGSQAQKKAAQQNADAMRETNAQNYRMFQEGRGSTGNAFLPLYMGDMEKNLGADATQFYNASKAMMGTPQEQFNRYQAAIGAYQPMMDASRGALGDVFNGNLTAARLGYAAPVAEARTGMAATQRQGVLQGLQERLNALGAGAARKGYSGTGSFAENRLLGATIGGRQAAAQALAGANLANAEDTRNIYDQGLNTKLQMMNQPYQQAQQALNMEMLPMSQVQANFSRQMQPFEFFRMGPGAFQAQPLPQVEADNMWPAIMAGVGNFTSGLAGMYFGNQALNNARQYQAGLYGGVGGGLPSNWGSLGAGQQGAYMNQLANAAYYPQGYFE